MTTREFFEKTQTGELLLPEFASGRNFASIPNTICHALGVRSDGEDELNGLPILDPGLLASQDSDFEHVVVIFADALGWNHKERFEVLGQVKGNLKISKLRSQFPSTTYAHVTAMHTGLPVFDSAVYEWNILNKKLNVIINTMGQKDLHGFPGSIFEEYKNLETSDIYPEENFYEFLQKKGIDTNVIVPGIFLGSKLDDQIHRVNNKYPHSGMDQAIDDLLDVVGSVDNKTYTYCYFDEIDKASHKFGPDHKEVASLVERFVQQVKSKVIPAIAKSPKKTMLLVIADHGHIRVVPEECIYLDEQMPEVFNYLQPQANADRLPYPAGAHRDMYLHVKPEYLDKVVSMINSHPIADKLYVLPTAELFGADKIWPANTKLQRNIGNLLLLPAANNTIWINRPDLYKLTQLGKHGGMSPDEMEIPIFSYTN